MNELKVFVERCVRPIQAEGSKKLGMRRELYSHIEAVYEKERKRTESTEAAVRAAIKRMGDPVELTEELRGSLSLLDRWTGVVDKFSGRKFDDTPWQYAVRLARFSFVLIMMLYVPFISILVLIEGRVGFEQLQLVRLGLAVTLLGPIGGFAFGWFFAILRDCLEPHGWHAGLLPMVLWISLASFLIALAAGGVFFLIVSGDVQATAAYLPRWIPLGLLAGPGLLWAAGLDAKLTRGLREWQELQIEE